ncbi:outer membrane lipoprotein carrier protein LolA [Epibacterium ulvae]|uniref:LolA family protein n=1 Tax=Epibacterium ulvae TaxID=1156985 RepID=UPI001BFC3672|nr:outer membrane lipoprotein carrier protein LolA [Epibacterium ulvae]MBT8153479.1 outer membrane lipoprotein carrier protein LolA [Epibacterium ulvae]
MKHIALALAFVACSPAAWAAEKLSLDDISGYLNTLKTAAASFTQVNDDGSLSTGKLYLHRPGRMRFEYSGPDAPIVVASAGAVMIQDPKSNQPPETYPLRRTPLSVILARTVDLSRANMVVGHSFDGTATVVRAQDPEHPEYGSIDLMFTGEPVQLRKWVINDDAGGQTTVVLGALETGVKLSSKLFNVERGSDR